MKKLVLLSAGVLSLALLSFTVQEDTALTTGDITVIKDYTASNETASFLLSEELMIAGTPEKKSWSETKSLNESISKDSAKSLVSKKTKGTDCECDNPKPDEPKKDDETLEEQTFGLIQKYNI